VAVGDFDGDGDLDLATTNLSSSSLSILLGNGDGTFSLGPTLPMANPDHLAVGDLDGDGDLDLVAVNKASSQVRIYPGDGTGNFGAPFSPGSVSTPLAVAVADFNHDSRADLAIGSNSGSLNVLLGTGGGAFGPPATFNPGPGAPVFVVAADVDGNGFADVVAVNKNVGASVLLGDGLGGFGPAMSHLAGATPESVAVGDLDGDGDLDLVVANTSSNDVSVLLGDGAGGFGPAAAFPVGGSAQSVAIGDFNGDGLADVAVAADGLDAVVVLTGDGSGSFGPPLTFPTGTDAVYTVADDFDGDGRVDLGVANAGSNTVSILINTYLRHCENDTVQVFAVTSTNQKNKLQWLNPSVGEYVSTMIRYRTDTFPADETDGTLVTAQAGSLGQPDSYEHTGLVNGTTYYYSAFVDQGAGWFSLRQTVVGEPFDDTAGVKDWTYTTGATLLPAAGINGFVYLVGNDRALHALNAGPTGGDWPTGWTPPVMNGPAQARPTVSGVTVGAAGRVAFVGSQDGHVYASDAVSGAALWSSPLLGPPLPADDVMVEVAPSGIFAAFGGAHDLVLVGTRNSTNPNSFFGLHLADGTVAWEFKNLVGQGGEGLAMGVIGGQASVDYPNRRVYFASRARAGGSAHTVWCLDLTATAATLRWGRDLGDIDGSPVLRAGRLYVGTNAGKVYALDPDTGVSLWSTEFAVPPAEAGVKGLVWPAGSRLYFTTLGAIWALDDMGDHWANPVSVPVTSPSVPAFTGTYVYVGSGDGKLYELDTALGSVRSAALAGPTTAVGSPAMDFQNGLVYVGSDAGRVYAVPVPLP
jgi:outer membrane protein assembly factor BamB